MKRTLLFIACALASITMSAQEELNDYLPFVQEGKMWNVFRSDADFDPCCYLKQYVLKNEGIEKNGKTYMNMKLYRNKDDITTVYDAGLFREENRKVYMFDTDMQKEFLMFDYSLKVGDTYETYSYDYHKTMTYKVLSVRDCTKGPQLIRYVYNENADSMDIHRRSLKEWTVCSTGDESVHKTWIEGVGTLEGPLGNLRDVVIPDMCWDYLGYVECNDDNDSYLPFSFYDTLNGMVHGCNLPTGAENQMEDGKHHRLTYELEGDRLHVYGEVLTRGGLNNYAYFFEEPTDDPLAHKLNFEIQAIEPTPDPMPGSNGLSLHATDFYVPGFDPSLNYIVVDNQGEEHPVINRTPQNAYRPFVEDGKVWAVRTYPDGYGMVRDDYWTEYYYFDGDTIIGGQTCKQMKYITNADEENWVDGVFTPANRPQNWVGFFYEQDKKVYFAGNHRLQFELLYDFTLSSNDSIFSDDSDGPTWVVNKVSGGIPGFKGTYYEFRLVLENDIVERWLEGVGSDWWPWLSHPFGFAGSCGTLLFCSIGDEVIYCNSVFDDPYVMNARKRFDFTHTIKTQPKVRMKRVEERPLYGQYNNQQLGINLDPLDDAYLVRITDESGKAVYEKAINAGNIVGLNIDISAYAAGRYIVTVENANESFAGEFETQASGIEIVSNNKEEQSSSIYNLHGQRISSLQKGLNIVNGQKLYVK